MNTVMGRSTPTLDIEPGLSIGVPYAQILMTPGEGLEVSSKFWGGKFWGTCK